MIGNFWCNVGQSLYSLFDTQSNKKNEQTMLKKSVWVGLMRTKIWKGGYNFVRALKNGNYTSKLYVTVDADLPIEVNFTFIDFCILQLMMYCFFP